MTSRNPAQKLYLKDHVRIFLLSRVAWFLYNLFFQTWRIRVVEDPALSKAVTDKTPFIMAHWHGHELALMPMIRRYRLATMISSSKDGQIMNYAVTKMSGAFSEGSSTRQGAQALLGLVRLMRGGRAACVAVDGPKGPLHVVKPGVFELAKISRAQIFSTGVHVDRFFIFKKSWNQAILPKPFAKITIHFSFFEHSDLEDLGAKDESLRLRLAQSIHDAIQYAQPQITRNNR